MENLQNLLDANSISILHKDISEITDNMLLYKWQLYGIIVKKGWIYGFDRSIKEMLDFNTTHKDIDIQPFIIQKNKTILSNILELENKYTNKDTNKQSNIDDNSNPNNITIINQSISKDKRRRSDCPFICTCGNSTKNNGKCWECRRAERNELIKNKYYRSGKARRSFPFIINKKIDDNQNTKSNANFQNKIDNLINKDNSAINTIKINFSTIKKGGRPRTVNIFHCTSCGQFTNKDGEICNKCRKEELLKLINNLK